jgi:membrane protein DedA with SNARE-associated domain
MNLQHLLAGHGAWPYVVTFAWTFVEGETFVLFAGFAAAQGLLNAPLLLLTAGLGSFCGDQCYFWIGRAFGAKLLARRPAWRARVDKVAAILRRYDAGFILAFRFIYGVRNVSSFAIGAVGASGVGWPRFLILNFIAAFIWAASFVGAGYFSGRAFHGVLGRFAPQFSVAMLAALAAALIGAYLYRRLGRRRARARAQTAVPTLSKIDA